MPTTASQLIPSSYLPRTSQSTLLSGCHHQFLSHLGSDLCRTCSGTDVPIPTRGFCKNSNPSNLFNSRDFPVLHPRRPTTPLLPSEELSELGTCSASSFGPSNTHRHRQLLPCALCSSATTTSVLSHHQLPALRAAPTSRSAPGRDGDVLPPSFGRGSPTRQPHSCRAHRSPSAQPRTGL